MIIVKEIRIQNFLSVEDITIDFSNLGLCLVKGDNGSGKSTIYRKSLEYLLFGTVPEKLKADSFLSDFNPKESCVSGSLLIGNDVIKIYRYRNSKQFGNNLIVNLNGDDVSKTDNRETQKVINDIIGVDFETFESSTCFNSKAIFFAESGAAGRSALMSKILHLDKYEKAYKKVAAELVDIDSKISNLNIEYEMVSKSTEKDKNLIRSIEKAKADSSDLNKIRERVDGYKKRIYDIDRLHLQETSLRKEEKEEEEELAKIETEERNYYKELSALSSVITHIQKEGDKIVAGKVCKECKQEITKEHAESQSKKIDLEIQDKNMRYDEIKKDYDIITENIVEVKKRLGQIRERLNNINSKISEYNEIQRTIKTLEEEISYKEESKKRLNNALKIAKDNIEIGESRLHDIEVTIYGMEDKAKMLRFWKEGFSRKGIPNLLIDKSLGRLQLETNNYLSGSNLEIELYSQKELKSKEKREEIDIVVYNNGQKRSYDNLSAGEKKRVDIAFMFAIMDLSTNKFNISIMDEVFDSSLDSAGEELVFDILKERRKELDSIIVISHQSNLQDLFENVVTVVKEEDKSNVVRGRA